MGRGLGMLGGLRGAPLPKLTGVSVRYPEKYPHTVRGWGFWGGFGEAQGGLRGLRRGLSRPGGLRGAPRPQLSVKNCFIRGSVVRYVQLPADEVDTQLLQDAARKEALQQKQ